MKKVNHNMKRDIDPVSAKQQGNDVYRYMPAIRTLSIFSGIEEKVIAEVLKSARIVMYAKGAILFLENEQATHFHIVLEGWVKMFKANAGGEEAVLQMIPAGDSIVAAIFAANGLYSFSAQAAENSRILTIPASILHEYLSINNKLALNILSIVAMRSRHLISQLEQVTLKTVTERVGRFLLKNFLECGKRTGKFTLPYDKALIAAYLDMQPETFSRVLQHFKEQGIDIERDVVSLPDLFALCHYCDIALANGCPRHNTPECPLMGQIN